MFCDSHHIWLLIFFHFTRQWYLLSLVTCFDGKVLCQILLVFVFSGIRAYKLAIS
jgi:hypothetical protein